MTSSKPVIGHEGRQKSLNSLIASDLRGAVAETLSSLLRCSLLSCTFRSTNPRAWATNGTTFRLHFGSCAGGALVILVVWRPRVVVTLEVGDRCCKQLSHAALVPWSRGRVLLWWRVWFVTLQGIALVALATTERARVLWRNRVFAPLATHCGQTFPVKSRDNE